MAGRFLTVDEHAAFKSHFQERRVSGQGQTPQTLEAVVAGLLAGPARSANAAPGLHQSARVIQAHRNDGLSWVCERLADILQQRSPEVGQYHFKGQRAAAQLPEIVNSVGRGAALRVLRRAGLYRPKGAQRLLIGGGILVLAVVLVIGSEYYKTFINPIAIAVIGLLAAILANQIRVGGSEGDLVELSNALTRP